MDMSSPAAAPVTLDQTSNVGGLRLVQRGTYDPASGAVSGVEPYAAIWIAGGKIWRASATAGGTPSAAQVSSEANVGDPSPLNPTPFHLCDTAVVNDWPTRGIPASSTLWLVRTSSAEVATTWRSPRD